MTKPSRRVIMESGHENPARFIIAGSVRFSRSGPLDEVIEDGGRQSVMKMKQNLSLLVLFLMLGGCTVGTTALGVSLASIMATERTPIDHGASILTGKDCGILHVTRDRDSWCREYIDPQEQARQTEFNEPFCYHTLGGISCYDRPDPYRNRDTPVR